MGSPILPPFGIRELDDAGPYSVVQVDSRQYQSTLKANPDAALSYLDEDDGENVTVGSSFELKQRLEDPTTPTAPLITCYNSATKAFEDRIIHLFDIQRTTASRDIWRNHQALYTKQQEDSKNAQDEKDDHSSISSFDINLPYASNSGQISNTTRIEQNPLHSERRAIVATDLTKNLSEAIPDLVDNLANLLQSTSETLRKAAEKTRGSNTSPIEDVLTGMNNIVTEIGSFGLSLLDQFNDSSVSNTSKYETTSQSTSTSSQVRSGASKDNIVPVKEASDINIDVSVSPLDHEVARTTKDQDLKDADTQARVCNFCSTCKLQCRQNSGSSNACHNCVTLGQLCSLTTESAWKASIIPKDDSFAYLSSRFAQKDTSILDQDTEDADFSRRYPPLMTLRRANTVAGLHDHFAARDTYAEAGSSLGRHNSWLKRFPHRPSPQVLDSETQRRRHFARNCFPVQRYTPGTETQEKNVPPTQKPSSFESLMDRTETNDHHGHVWKPFDSVPSKTLSNSIAKPDPLDTLPETNKASQRVPTSVAPTTTSLQAEANVATLPGAWPEPTENRKTINAPTEESSGAFFHRMMRDNPSRKQCHASDTNERLIRHRSFSKQRPNRNPFRDLNRSQTTTASVNPASRLNKPFEPFYPVVPSTENSAAKVDGSGVRNNSAVPSNSTSQPPARLADRSSWMHRPFSPVWEDQLSQTRSHAKNQDNLLDSLDRNGESSSMYSPPPRHMRSVPNFSTVMNAPLMGNLATSKANSQVNGSTKPAFHLNERLSVGPNGFYDAKSLANTSRQSKPSEPKHRQTLHSGIKQEALKSHTSATDIATSSVVNSVPERPTSPKSTIPIVQECLNTLRDMGYGSDDFNLLSRLHIYAEAADGNIGEAVDMIEEEKKASSARPAGLVLKKRSR